jgi:hypothetical protein
MPPHAVAHALRRAQRGVTMHPASTNCIDQRTPLVPYKGVGSKSGTGDNGMSDDLTNSQIALLCDVGEFHLPNLTGDQKRDLERLISGGYVGSTESHARSSFMLTAKGIEFLGKRGAGLNEA